MLEQNLSQLGLKKEEIKIYLELLKRGNLSVTAIASFTKIPRINCYHHLLNLKKKNFVIESKKNKMKHFSAENPRIFLTKVQEQKNIVDDILPELKAIMSIHSAKPQIQFFEDKNGIKQIFEKINEQKIDKIFSFTNFATLSEIIPLKTIERNLRERVSKKIKSQFICPLNETSEHLNRTIFRENTDFFEVFFVSSQKFPLQSEITIFDNHVITLNLNKNTPIGTVLIDKEVFRAQKNIFDLAWLAVTSFIGQ